MADDIPEQLCAEFALGILEGAEREKALQLIKTDPTFAAEVDRWHNYLSPLSEALPPVDVSERLLSRLDNELDQREQGTAEHNSEQYGKNISDQLLVLNNRLNVWRRAAVSFAAAAMVFGFAVLYFITTGGDFSGGDKFQYVAVLRDDKGQDGFVVTLSSGQKYVMVRSLGMWPPESKSYELWAMYEEKESPATLGLVATSPYVKLKMPKVLHRENKLGGLKLAVSLEPEGGAPKGKNMGQIMFAGRLVQQMP
ncbi:MAG: anti-sigma factor [Methyloligellaceae bacterium]